MVKDKKRMSFIKTNTMQANAGNFFFFFFFLLYTSKSM